MPDASTVAREGSEDDHVPPLVGSLSETVNPWHTVGNPEIGAVPATTVIVVESLHPEPVAIKVHTPVI
jgi:hypothetical protein